MLNSSSRSSSVAHPAGGQVVDGNLLTRTGGENQLFKVTTASDSSRVGLIGLDHLNFDWKVPSGSKYTIQVRSSGYIGNYAFTASEAKPQHR